jgi:transposase
VRPKRSRGTGRKRGGQFGHEGKARSFYPPEEVDQIEECYPEVCEHCGEKDLYGSDPEPVRHQTVEIPLVLREVTEYRLHRLTCRCCGASTRAELPAGVPAGAFGPRLQAFVAFLTGRMRLPKRAVEELLETCMGIEMGLGSVCAIEKEMSGTLEKPVEEAKGYVREQGHVQMDETSWREENRRAVLWVVVTKLVIIFAIRASRARKWAEELIGKDYSGFLTSDRYAVYDFLNALRRQVCWSHLDRDFERMSQAPGEAGRIGRDLLRQAEQVFDRWYRVRDGTIQETTFRRYMRPIMAEVGRLLREGASCAHARTRGTCKEILSVETALWTFVFHYREGVEPTNNASERGIRPAVIWRKLSFGTQSEAGSRYVERMLTVVMTLRQQKRNVFEYLVEAAQARLDGRPAPSILPEVHATPCLV